MSGIQTNIFAPNASIGRTYFPVLLSQPSCRKFRHLNVPANLKFEHRKAFPKLVYSPPNCRRCSPIFSSGATGNSNKEDQSFPWDPLKRAFSGFKQERTVQDLLKQQMQKREFDGNGGDGGSRGGGGDGFGDGEGGEEDEGLSGILDEVLQVFLATIGFIFVYIYLIRGAELTRLARDYIRYLLGGPPSVRLSKAMTKWKDFYDSITWRGVEREDWLERAIVATPTWWHKPMQQAQVFEMIRARESQSDPTLRSETQTQRQTETQRQTQEQEISSDDEDDDDDDELY